jgi:hypothetical protein
MQLLLLYSECIIVILLESLGKFNRNHAIIVRMQKRKKKILGSL